MGNSIIKGCKFTHIALRANDFEKSYKFYTEGLGLKDIAHWGDPSKEIALLELGDGNCIELFSEGSDKGAQDEQKGGTYFHLALGVDDSSAAYERALKCGATSKAEPKEVTIQAKPNPLDVKIAFVYGPSGEILEFFQTR